LPDHSADVAAVLEALLRVPTIIDRLARLAGERLSGESLARLAALAFLHDIGKANRGFRGQFRAGVKGEGHIQPLAWLLHGSGSEALQDRLFTALRAETWAGWLTDGARPLLDAVFAHHGRPWRTEGLADCRHLWRAGPDMDPIADLAVMGDALPRWFPAAFASGPALPATPAFHHAYAGLLMLADWLGSDETFFPFANGQEADRMAFARGRAEKVLSAVGLGVEPVRLFVRDAAPDFATAFAVPSPRPVQLAAIGPEARCVVLEAETGSGKTEAALWRFLHLFQSGAVDGLYFALPTRVAATQAFQRVCRFADRVFGTDRPTVVLAVPGQQMADGVRGHALPDFGFAWDDDPTDAVRQARWAAEHPKRFLAAQIAVGTVDQALLGAIQVRHAHLRGAALLRQLLVVDEVHASDRYMERLLAGLLRDHLRAGGHALLLSATLGAGMRARLLGCAVPSPEVAEAMPYPALSWAAQGVEQHQEVAGTGTGKTVAMTARPLLDEPAAVGVLALDAGRRGAKVLVIRNTVGDAVATQGALEALDPDGAHVFRAGGVATLHHGRFAAEDRRLLDASVERQLGKDRPEGGLVVVGTQTLEVSLDLDADLLLTDLCPVDVLLQRMGRLHRHERVRPAGFEAARVVVLVPPSRDLLPFARRGRHGLGGMVYDDLRGIEATWRLIEAHDLWRIPAMNRMLVERGTHPERLQAIAAELLVADPAWQTCFNRCIGAWTGQGQQAGYALLDRTAPFDSLVFDADDRLATRLGAADRLLRFDRPLPGPFGQDITTLRLPSHMLPQAGVDAEPTETTAAEGIIAFALGARRYRYDRFGLRTES
jgi:CRISPR-associated endonuclease/helicase Cas3